MTALHRKLFRDLLRLRAPVLTIALVVAAGVASYVSMKGNYTSLQVAKERYYRLYRFADVFAAAHRVPDVMHARLQAIDGVAVAHTRIRATARIPLEGARRPATAHLLSLDSDAPLGRVHLREGRMFHDADEVLLNSAFADAQALGIGDELGAVVEGKLRKLRIVGIAMSPEYVFNVAGGELAADPDMFAVLWMDRSTLAPMVNMEGAFNSALFQLEPGASERAVISSIDGILEPYGSVGAYSRARQPSSFMLEGELAELDSTGTALPLMFLAVAAFLLNVVLSRLVMMQRAEIATLKAVGYSDGAIARFYLGFVLAVVLLGVTCGVLFGAWLGTAWTALYREFFHFPDLAFRLGVRDVVEGAAISLSAALLGAFGAVRGVLKLQPAEAMRPAAPARYRKSIVEWIGLAWLVGPAARMVLREIERRPLRTLLSATAIAFSVALLVVGRWFDDGMQQLMHVQFESVMREDATVTLDKPRSERSVRELGALPGVLHAEGMRTVPVRFRVGQRHRDGAINGYPTDGELRGVIDARGRPFRLPLAGVILTDKLAEILGVGIGDLIQVEIREGARRTQSLRVAGVVEDLFGLQGHMRLPALHRWLGEEAVVSQALLRIDAADQERTYQAIERLPGVANITRRRDILARFRAQSGEMMGVVGAIVTLLSLVVCVGVVYNNARVALSVRSRDLASLRVLGFTRGEVAGVLIGEMAAQVLLALPLGLLFGYLLVVAIASNLDPETYRLPVVVTSQSYAFAAGITVVASVVSALLVRRRLDRIDLVSALKTRE